MYIRELPPSEFRFGNYGADIPTAIYLSKDKMIPWLKEQNILGYQENPEYRTIEGHVAILFLMDEIGEYWSHIPDYVFYALQNDIDINEAIEQVMMLKISKSKSKMKGMLITI